jgi:hypothetical protein
VTAIALLAMAGALYAFASYRREQRVPADGGALNDRLSAVISIAAIGVSIAAVAASVLYMFVQLWGLT